MDESSVAITPKHDYPSAKKSSYHREYVKCDGVVLIYIVLTLKQIFLDTFFINSHTTYPNTAQKAINSLDAKPSTITTAVTCFCIGSFELIVYWLSTTLPHRIIPAFDNLLWIPILVVGAVTIAGFGFVIGCIRA